MAALAAALEASPFRALILDLRQGDGDSEEAFYPLLHWLCRRETPLGALLGQSEIFVNYTHLNCELKAAALSGMDGAEAYISELREKAGQGLVAESVAPEDTIIPGYAPSLRVVLTDTWCRGAGEELAMAARNAGAVLIGRPTLGTLDYSGLVSCALDERYVLTWPTAITRDAREGRGTMGRGIQPDVCVPWTPQECAQDVLLDTALNYIQEKS